MNVKSISKKTYLSLVVGCLFSFMMGGYFFHEIYWHKGHANFELPIRTISMESSTWGITTGDNTTTNTITRETSPWWSVSRQNQWSQETTQGWTQSVLDCSKIVLHNDQATEIARYMCNIEPDADMLATFMQESWFNPRARWKAWERWICQLMHNRTNIVRLDDPRWDDWRRQAEVCIDKRKAVPSKWVIWMAYAVRHKYLHYFK